MVSPTLPGRIRSGAAVLALLLLVVPRALRAQDRAPDPRLFPSPGPVLQSARTTQPGTAFLASALLPGSGQYLLGANRWVPYAVVEAWAWVTYFDRRSRAHTLTREYRDLARSVPRRPGVGERRDTVWEYYEAMSKFPASGAFDADPGRDGVQPEPDTTTFNGDLWRLARALYFPYGAAYPEGSPQYAQALAYYERYAIAPTFAWAWGDSFLELRTFRELIHDSDEAYRSATHYLGVILANHLVSAIDALILGRIEGATEGALSARLAGVIDEFGDPRWTITVRLGTGWW